MMLDPDREHDPLDYSRTIIRSYAVRVERYASMLAECAEMRDDDGANLMRRRLVGAVNEINDAFKMLASARATEPDRAAVAFFEGAQSKVAR